LPTRWSLALPAGVSTWTQSVDGTAVAVGMTNGDVVVLDEAGSLKWQAKSDSAVTALKFSEQDLIVGTHSGKVYRFNDSGKLHWHYACQFRNEREIWPWWFMPTPAIGAIAVGHDPIRDRDLIVVGNAGTSLNFLEAKTGTLITDALSRYGWPDRIKAHLAKPTGELRFLAGHSRLTCGSTVRAWGFDTQIAVQYEKSVTPMGRSIDGWDSSGVVDFWVGTLAPNEPDKVVVLRHGAVNQITAYEESTGEPLWDATLGDAPVALVVIPGDSNGEARYYVAGQFGGLVTFDGKGNRINASRVAPSITGMQAGPNGTLVILNDNELHIVRVDLPTQCFTLSSPPLGLAGPTHNPGLLCLKQTNLILKDIPW
jgi:hypothetical protein